MVGVRTVIYSLIFSALSTARQEKRQDTDVPTDSDYFLQPSNYLSQKWHRAIVVGDYLYIDGGEIVYRDGDNQTQHVSAQNTYSIDLNLSWTNATVRKKRINKAIDGRALNSLDLWRSLDNSSFYSYNGDESWWFTPAGAPANTLYKFMSNGSGDGQWTTDEQGYTPNSNFQNLARVGGTDAACGRDVCYAVGGRQNSRTKDGLSNGGFPSSGVVSYNLTSHTWRNDTMVGAVFPQGHWNDGRIFYTDIAGTEGALVALGGTTSDASGTNFVPLSLDYVYIYDIANKTWYQQLTSGDIPSRRDSFCAVGIRGGHATNASYEMFIYGGVRNDLPDEEVQDVWVLSLPSFSWHRVGAVQDRPRQDHWCNVVGQRQMIINGGINPRSLDSQDTWPSGVGIFDLTDLRFSDRYDPAAPAYASPLVVQKWYADNGPWAVNIDSDVKKLFVSASTNDNTPPKSGKKHTAAIVGGVIGGLAVLAAIIVGIWMYTRRKNNRSASRMPQTYPAPDNGPHEISSKQIRGYEIGGQEIYQKDVQRYPRWHELYGNDAQR